MERVINIPFECLGAEKSFCGWWMAWQNRVTPSPSPLRFRIKTLDLDIGDLELELDCGKILQLMEKGLPP